MFRVALTVLLVSPEAYNPDSGFYASGFAEETKVWSLVYKQARFRTQKVVQIIHNILLFILMHMLANISLN